MRKKVYQNQFKNLTTKELEKLFRETVLSGEEPGPDVVRQAKQALSESVGISVESMDLAEVLFSEMVEMAAVQIRHQVSMFYLLVENEERHLTVGEVIDIVNASREIHFAGRSAFDLPRPFEEWLGASEVGAHCAQPNHPSPFLVEMPNGSEIFLTEGQINLVMILCKSWTKAARILESA